MIYKLQCSLWCGFNDFSLPLEDCQYEKESWINSISYSCAYDNGIIVHWMFE